MKPWAVDLCCGSGGWTDGFMRAGFRVTGVDIIQHPDYKGELILADIRQLPGGMFSGAKLIVASPPCIEFTRWALPWCKQLTLPDVTLFYNCLRIGREAKVPIIIENVRWAQIWVGRSVLNIGPYHLWGDGVPALMPMAIRRRFKETISGRRSDLRARIPDDLADWIAGCYYDG